MLGLGDNVSNRITFGLRNVSWVEYPSIRGRLRITGKGKIEFGKNVQINSSFRSNPVGLKSFAAICAGPEATVSIGNNVGISNALIYAWASVTIEDDVRIGGGCQIFDTDFHSISYTERILKGDKKTKTAPVLIGKGAFIGTSCIISKGVTVGKRSIIAAGSVVSKNIPPDEIWGGNPCSYIKDASA